MPDWSEFLAACVAAAHGEVATAALGAGLPTALFLLGLAGGATHCSGMCGPFVLAQVGSRLGAVPFAGGGMRFARLAGLALLPYHAGRITTYTALGAAAAGMTGGAQAALAHGYVPSLALALAAAAFVVAAAIRFLPRPARASGVAAGLFGPGGALAALFRRPEGPRGYALGVLLGFLPCGLVYTALLPAGATGTWREGALAMAGFAAGTVPALVVVGVLGAAAAARWRNAARRLLVPVLLLNAAVLLVLAFRWWPAPGVSAGG